MVIFRLCSRLSDCLHLPIHHKNNSQVTGKLRKLVEDISEYLILIISIDFDVFIFKNYGLMLANAVALVLMLVIHNT
jgi:hypothetical protein